MTKADDVARLGQISQLVLDVKLAALHLAASKRQQSLDLLAALNVTKSAPGLSPVAEYQAQVRYQHWAEARRAELNQLLARQTADLNTARDDAALAFGKDQALRGLRAKLL